MFDMNSSIFEGLELLQKFTNKSSYDTRFIWINLHSFTIHMSQYMSKERRHKEASLKDIQSIIPGAPARSKQDLNPSCCMTINFRRGGGIDLVFKSETDRNLWSSTMNKVLEYMKETDPGTNNDSGESNTPNSTSSTTANRPPSQHLTQ
jgi:hypothetical protein